ncbi:MAG TPA: glycosyltransferase family 2 protein [Candidatus Acidoferrales bacterium]|nr:glycosyltransferase family 2 protein [Candidatus Acidoferrales bacterium]
MPDRVAIGATVLLAPVAFGLAAIATYLLVLTAAAFVSRSTPPPASTRKRMFAVVVPAHDEARVIARVLDSLARQTYPRERYDVVVVADNCTDSTALIAREHGAIVHERHDEARAKGHALRWILQRLAAERKYDAYAVFDADSFVAPDFLERTNARLDAGSRVIQGHYRVLNAGASDLSAVREAALGSLHLVRPRGRAALGLSAGLKGNGMVFDAATLERHGWPSTGLAEDVEMHLGFVAEGVRTDFAPEAVVRADMPTTFAEAASQNLRWEAGRLASLGGGAVALLSEGIRLRDPMRIDAAAEQLIPPMSVALAASAAVTVASLATGAALPAALAGYACVAMGVHVLSGLVATGAPPRSYLTLAKALPYVAWKIGIYVRAMALPRATEWIRTTRPDTSWPDKNM